MIKDLTAAEVLQALNEAKAVGKLTVAGDHPVTIIGSEEDRERARAVLETHGWTLTRSAERDEWTS